MTSEPFPIEASIPPSPVRSRFRSDLIANFAGQGWAALMQLLFIPLYVRFLGIEGYGLVGFHVVLLSIGRVLDFGLSPTVTRELARKSVLPESASECRDLVKTLQTIYWAVGISVGAAILLLAWVITAYWIGPSSLPASEVQSTVMAMGILFMFQWPLAFYQGALMGLQRQVLMNGVRMTMSTVGASGAVLVLWLVSPTPIAYFTWQILVNAIHVGILATLAWRALPPGPRVSRFRRAVVSEVWHFAAGTSAIMATGIVLSQADKLVVSKFLTLADFGYYSVASTAATGLFLFIHPLYNSLFPRFSSFIALGDEAGLRLHYRRGLQVMGSLIFPASALLVLFTPEILLVWTRDPRIADNASWILRFLVAGTALNGMMYIPFALQLAMGWTSLGIKVNLAFLVTMIPLSIIMAFWHGPAGVASVWLLLNLLQVLAVLPLMHRRVLIGEAPSVLLRDVGLPILLVACLIGAVRLLAPMDLSPLPLLAVLLLVFTVSIATVGMVSSSTREWIVSQIRTLRRDVSPDTREKQ